jgi:Amt family ammonium transporter
MIGVVGGLLVVPSIVFMDRTFKIDDPVGAISVHGVVGIWGLLAVPLTNPDASFGSQLLGIAVIFAWVFSTSLLVWFVLRSTVGIRVGEAEEYEGVDLGECGVEAYPEFAKSGD